MVDLIRNLRACFLPDSKEYYMLVDNQITWPTCDLKSLSLTKYGKDKLADLFITMNMNKTKNVLYNGQIQNIKTAGWVPDTSSSHYKITDKPCMETWRDFQIQGYKEENGGASVTTKRVIIWHDVIGIRERRILTEDGKVYIVKL
jgi:hypothetical protein